MEEIAACYEAFIEFRGEKVVDARIASILRGSGTRLYFDHVLSMYAEKLRTGSDMVSGFETEFFTHEEVARQIYEKNFDAGAVLRYLAEEYGLRFFHLTWETYECYSLVNRRNEAIDRLRELMKSEWFGSLVRITPGCRI